MNTKLETVPQTPLTRDQIELLKSTIAAGTTDDEFRLFLEVCRKTGLDPFSRQIYVIRRGGKATHQISIDGARAIADRSGCYAGNDDPVFDDETKPRKATVTVWKIVHGQRYPFTASARWDHYYPGPTQGFVWDRMPHLMIGKVAESLALRKAFPYQLSGLYTHEEMQQADSVRPGEKKLVVQEEDDLPPLTESEKSARNEAERADSAEKKRPYWFTEWKGEKYVHLTLGRHFSADWCHRNGMTASRKAGQFHAVATDGLVKAITDQISVTEGENGKEK